MNREQLVESIARAQWDRMEGRNPQPWPWSSADEAERTEYLSVADAALSVALDAILGPIEALHTPDPSGEHCDHCWSGPTTKFIPSKGSAASDPRFPCPTIALCDQIDAAAGVQR